ncbi:MAG: amino acid decarboxylase [Clostridia bacterium]|nr:amino acid decarboxylase [Clostridia bacterium]
MDTPILDFLQAYARKQPLRLHMPGHKGQEHPWDITEIKGADSLYEADGIIAQSEQNASRLFGCPTFYSTEGSSQCIRAMLHLARLDALSHGKTPLILAGRNAHKTFLSGVAMLDLSVEWLYPEAGNYLSCALSSATLETALQTHRPTAVYLTCPDYLGNRIDLTAAAELCHRYGALLLVDNAHGAYLKFMGEHPMDLGADLCCDSAHKTLPVLTGGAYLHTTPALAEGVKEALALFGSTSPSYLILGSLDKANAVLSENFGEKLTVFAAQLTRLRATLTAAGFETVGDEALKLTLCPKSYGYTGTQLADCLREAGMEAEFADPDFLTLMFSPEMGAGELSCLGKTLLALPRRTPITTAPPRLQPGQRVLSPRQAMLSPARRIAVEESVGQVLAAPSVGCPPAVPIVVSGERIDESALSAFAYYGITEISVVKNK